MSVADYYISGVAEPLLASVMHPEDRKEEWAISPNYYDWYVAIGKALKPKRIMELGVRYGYSLICMAHGATKEGVEGGHLYGIDFDSNALQIASTNLQSLPLISSSLVCKHTHEVTLADTDNAPVDLVHLDSSHSWHVIGELEIAFNLLQHGGHIVIDDVSSFETNTAWLRMKKQHLDAVIWNWIYENKIQSFEYLNTYRGTYIITL